MKLEVHDSFKKDEKITKNFVAVIDEDVVNKAYLDEKVKNKWSFVVFRKRVQRIYIRIKKRICRRGLSSKSCKNDDTINI